MTTYIAMLRGINVSGRNRVPMEDLRALFLGLGHREVTTYIQSGNVVFRSPLADPAAVAVGAEQRIADQIGLEVRVLVRTRADLGEVIAARPFDPAALHVTFLDRVPEPDRVRVLDPQAGAPDDYRLGRREVYLRCPNGYGRTKLNNAFWERRLAVAATTRNWNTVLRLHEMAGA